MSGGGSIAPRDLKQQVSKTARQFSGYGQQDAQEFLRFLLDGMHNELNRIEAEWLAEDRKFINGIPIFFGKRADGRRFIQRFAIDRYWLTWIASTP